MDVSLTSNIYQNSPISKELTQMLVALPAIIVPALANTVLCQFLYWWEDENGGKDHEVLKQWTESCCYSYLCIEFDQF